MPATPLPWVILVLGIVAGTVQPLASQLAPSPHTAMPDSIGAFVLRETKTYDDPAQGTLYRYGNADQVVIDVFVYPVSGASPAPGVAVPDSLLASETNAFKRTLLIGVQRGWYDDFEVAYEQSDTVSGLPGRQVAVAIRRGQDARISHFFLFLQGSRFIKMRATVPVPVFEQGTVPAFVDALLTRLSRAAAAPCTRGQCRLRAGSSAPPLKIGVHRSHTRRSPVAPELDAKAPGPHRIRNT